MKIRTNPAGVLLMAFIVLTCLVGTGFGQTMPASPQVRGDEQDVEVLLSTLNEVLEENRKIRQELLSSEDSLRKLAKENNLLRNQVSRLKRETEKTGEEGQQRITQMERTIQELEQSVSGLAQENERLEKLRSYHEKRIPLLEKETAQLHRLLDASILEGERGEYLNLIQNAQEMANRSLEELAASKSGMVRLRREMGQAHYKLGNMLFDMRDFENAISSYHKALEVDPMDAWVHHNLGIIYDYYVHDDHKALYHYGQYLRLAPVEEEAHQIRERILELELKKNMAPSPPLSKNYFENYTKKPR